MPALPSLRPPPDLLERRRLTVLGLVGLSALLASYNGSILVLALPAVAHDFDASVPDIANLGSGLQLGALIGLPLAMLADRLGRRRLLAIAVLGFSLANAGSAAAPALAWLAAARVVAVAFETVAGAVAVALVIEEMPADRRGLAVAAITIAGGAGLGLVTVLYPLLAPHWRWLYLLGCAGIPAAPALAHFLPESGAWAASRPVRLPLRVLLAAPWRRRLLVGAMAAVLSAIFFEPANILLALFASSRLGFTPALISAGVVASGLISLPAFPLGGWLSDRYGRRWLAVLLGAGTAAAGAATFAGSAAAYWAGVIAWSFLASASVPIVGAWYGELFPTRARATSEAAATVAGAAGGVLGLQLVAALQPHLGLGSSLVAAAAAALAGAAVLLALPETRAEPLPE